MATPTHALLTAPPLSLLLRMTVPNASAFLIQSGVGIAEIWIIGQLGTASLAAMALVFPLLMLFQTISAGAFGGAVSSAIARSLGRGDRERAERLVWQSLYLAVFGAVLFFTIFMLGGAAFLRFLGGTGEVLDLAMRYAIILFSGGIAIWLFGIVSAVFRGSGDMTTPAILMTLNALLQVPLTGALVLGWFGAPQIGMPGAAMSALALAALSDIAMLALLMRAGAPLRLRMSRLSWDSALMEDILQVARPAALNPIMTVATIIGLTALVGRFGADTLAGYGIGARIEYLLLPVVFGFGTALTTIVGTNIGAQQVARAEQTTLYGAGCVALFCGCVGFGLAAFPDAWIPIFTDDAGAFASAKTYIGIVGPAYPFFGVGLLLYFASQGASVMFWPVSAMVIRFILSLGAAMLAVLHFGAPVDAVFWCAACGMVLYASIIALSIYRGAWRKHARPRG